MEKFFLSSKVVSSLILISASFVLSGCPSIGGSGEITMSNNPSSGGTTGGISITNIYPTSQGSSWSATNYTDTTGLIYIKGNSLSIVGTCSRGVSAIQVLSDGTAFSEKATCNQNGTFTWTRAFTAGAEATYSLSIRGLAADGTTALTSTAIAKSVRVDDVAPSAFTITSPASPGSTYVSQNTTSSITISGTLPADTYRITGPSNNDSLVSGNSFTISGTSWSLPVTMVSGSSTAYTFYAYDRAGNQTAATTVTITWTPTISMLVSGAALGTASASDGGSSGFTVEASATPQTSYSTDGSGASYTLDTGFNRMVNQKRADSL